jgi:hypothetical protein
VEVQVLISGTPAVIHYKGRSAEFPGLDQIQFQVPEGVAGCYVPVVVLVNGVSSNFGTMAINAEGGACSDQTSFIATDLGPAAQGADTVLGHIVLVGLDYMVPGLQADVGLTSMFAEFSSVSHVAMLQSLGPLGFSSELPPASTGACFVYHGPGSDLEEFDDRTPATRLNAGSRMNMTAPFGPAEIEADDFSFETGTDEGNLIVPGLYSFDNGSGGGEVGSFQASITVPATQFAWTNRDTIQKVDRSQDLTVTWTGGDDSQEVVAILGHSGRRDKDVMGLFMCAERPSAGQFTLPSWLLSTLPANTPWDMDSDPVSGLVVVRMSRLDQNRFTASGIHAGFLYYVLGDYLIVPYE